jgi:hypothetical protein
MVGAFLLVAGMKGLSLALPAKTILVLLGPRPLIFLLGLYDDLRYASLYTKFAVQTVAATILNIGEPGIHRLDLKIYFCFFPLLRPLRFESFGVDISSLWASRVRLRAAPHARQGGLRRRTGNWPIAHTSAPR